MKQGLCHPLFYLFFLLLVIQAQREGDLDKVCWVFFFFFGILRLLNQCRPARSALTAALALNRNTNLPPKEKQTRCWH